MIYNYLAFILDGLTNLSKKDIKIILTDLKKHKWYGQKYFKQDDSYQMSEREKIINHPDPRLTLDHIHRRTRNEYYSSIFKFYLDLLYACSNSNIIGPACKQQQRRNKFKQLCIQAIESVFPWFDVQNTSLISDFFYSKENNLESLGSTKKYVLRDRYRTEASFHNFSSHFTHPYVSVAQPPV